MLIPMGSRRKRCARHALPGWSTTAVSRSLSKACASLATSWSLCGPTHPTIRRLRRPSVGNTHSPSADWQHRAELPRQINWLDAYADLLVIGRLPSAYQQFQFCRVLQQSLSVLVQTVSRYKLLPAPKSSCASWPKTGERSHDIQKASPAGSRGG